MAKKDQKQSSEERARRKLIEAQAAFNAAQEARAQVRLEGEQDVERARQRAAERLARATLRVERRAEAVALAEQELERARIKDTAATRAASAGTGSPS